jgi:nitrogen regulatory protein PII
LIIALVDDQATDDVMKAARHEGATGATIVNQARGEGLQDSKTFLGLSLESHRDMVLFLVEEHLSRKILERISEVAKFDSEHGAGIAFQIDVEDAVGIAHHVKSLEHVVEEEI